MAKYVYPKYIPYRKPSQRYAPKPKSQCYNCGSVRNSRGLRKFIGGKYQW